MQIGYARVSNPEQNLDMQIDALKQAGCERVYCEDIPTLSKRSMPPRKYASYQPELKAALKALRPGDTLAVWSLDRLGLLAKRMFELLEELSSRDIAFEIVSQKINTSTAMGKSFLKHMALMADTEAILLSERAKSGLRALKVYKASSSCGSKSKLSKEQVQHLYEDYSNPHRIKSIPELARAYGICVKTLYNQVNPIIERKKAENAQQKLFKNEEKIPSPKIFIAISED